MRNTNNLGRKTSNRKQEQGITIFVVAAVIVAVLGMAALAIDLIALYVAHGQAQRAADAAALAGAKMFVTSGFTSNPSTWMLSNICQTSGPGAAAAANQQAEAVAKANNIAGQQVTVQSIKCPFSTLTNPTITVKVQQTGLPSYFAKVWGQTMNSVSATSTAEAYNPSTGGVPIQAFVKPLLVPDCNPAGPAPPCAAPFFTPANAPAYIAQSFTFVQRGTGPPPVGTYQVLNLAGQATACPSVVAVPAGSCALAGGGGVYDNMACANTTVSNNTVDCGDSVTILPSPVVNTDVISGTQCLIHTNGSYTFIPPQTSPCPDVDSDCVLPPTPPPAGKPVTFTGGRSNPDPAFRSGGGNPAIISRSDSIVTVPLYNGATDPCPGGITCSGPVAVTGFLELGIQYVGLAGSADAGKIKATILNAASCTGTGGTTVSGGGVSPVPVRLIE